MTPSLASVGLESSILYQTPSVADEIGTDCIQAFLKPVAASNKILSLLRLACPSEQHHLFAELRPCGRGHPRPK